MKKIEQPSNTERPKSEKVKSSEEEHELVKNERPKSEHPGGLGRRQVSFQLDRKQDVEQDSKDMTSAKPPVIRRCSFQRKQHLGDKNTHAETKGKTTEIKDKKKSLADLLPELMKKFKTELGCKAFIVNTRKAIDRKKLVVEELSVPKERQWIRGNDMQAFYHTWQTTDDHIKDQSVRPRTVKRSNSLPKTFRVRESEKTESKKVPKKLSSDFGIVRQCCSRPRIRIPSFMDHDSHDKHHHHHEHR